jgi:hypothetical protein
VGHSSAGRQLSDVSGWFLIFCEGFPQRRSLFEPCVAGKCHAASSPAWVGRSPAPRCFTASYFGNHLIAQILPGADSFNSFCASAAPKAKDSPLHHSQADEASGWVRRHGATRGDGYPTPHSLTAPLLNPVD